MKAFLGVWLAFSLAPGPLPAAKAAHTPSAADLERLNKSLNPTPTPALFGVESRLNPAGHDVDQKGNHLFTKTQVPTAKEERERHLPMAKVTPAQSFRSLSKELLAFDADVDRARATGLISKERAQTLKERLSLLRLKYRLDQNPDGAALTPEQRRKLRDDLHALRKDLR